jgi:hypothetical protein
LRKFGGGGVAELMGCSVLILQKGTFRWCRASKEMYGDEQTTWSLRTSKQLIQKRRGRTNWTESRIFEKKGRLLNMATYRDPVTCFAPLEVIERLLEIRVEAGFSPAVYLLSPDDLADYLDAYGFDVYALSEAEAEFHFGDYRAPLAPGGDHAHCSLTAH